MTSASDRSPAGERESHPSADNSSHHFFQEIWNDLSGPRNAHDGSSGRGSGSGTGDGADSVSFSNIYSDLRSDYSKLVSWFDNIFHTGNDQTIATTGIEKGSQFPLDNVGNMGVTTDSSGRPADLEYADGSKRHFEYKGNDITGFTDRDGHNYSREANGQWDGPDGKPANISNVTVMPDGTFSYKESETGNIIVCALDGSFKTVTPDDLGDLKLYPDSQDRAAENTRLQQQSAEPGFLNADGQRLLTQLNKLGVDDVDALYGSHIVFGGDGTRSGDGGALYRQLIQEYPVKQRTSSHYPGTKTAQYQIVTGPANSAVLFGLTPDGNTFLQFEHNVAGTTSHTDDYNLYRTLDQNIGPLGTSPHTDKNPLTVGYQP